MVRLLCFFLTLYSCISTQAQDLTQTTLDQNITISQNYNGTTDELLLLINKQTGLTISYSNRVYANKNVKLSHTNAKLSTLLDMIFSRLPVQYIVKGEKIIVAPIKPRYFTLSGYCKDAYNGEALIGANIYDTLLYSGQGTNGYGFFSLTLPEGKSAIRASFVGYKPLNTTINLHADTMIIIYLQPSAMLDDITITVDKDNPHYGHGEAIRLTMEQMRGMPSLLGETDVIKSLEWTPSVHGGEEGYGGMSVRGGNADENIVMLDDVPLYSPNHLVGLYSVFNAESVNSAELIKGGFAARYGGRMSSVLDVKMREGNMKKFAGCANIGLLSSNATFEGPILKDRISFILSARRTYFDLFSSQIQRNSDKQYSFCFYDIHAKLNCILSPKDRIYMGMFVGYDNFGYGYNYRNVTISYGENSKKDVSINDKQKIQWGNIVASLRWNHVFGSSLFANTTFSLSRYRFQNMQNNYVGTGNIKYKNGYYSGINDFSARTDFTWYMPFMPSIVRAGAWITYHRFTPGISVHSTSENITDSTYTSPANTERTRTSLIYRFESHAYFEDEIRFDKLKINAGMHFSGMITPDNKFYVRAEPRLQVSYDITQRTHCTMSYSDMTQFLQQMRVATVASPADMWVPVSTQKGIPHSMQISGEMMQNIVKNIDITIGGYYKKNLNLQTYRNTQLTETMLTNEWDSMFYTGSGQTYGIELFIHRKTGRLSGFVGYSYMHSTAKFDEINNGNIYNADNDRTHSVSMYGKFMFNNNIDICATWQYSTGTPVTIPDNRYVMLGTNQNTYSYPVSGIRNAYRMPASHNLNIGVNIKRQKANNERCLSFGIYNVYAHKNPMFVYWKANFDNETNDISSYKLKQFNLIAWPWPYVKYSIKF